ncbi:alpha/beta hydrolase [Pseudoclavibacter sp. CFCC 14310]|uniref:alpha/beta fold hydrolase n=1 Tax=Pseudoclavibacter sp. CFCC 14310 TaxID=2615180 RepID=UPI0013013AE8|nr:alpha/beta fold hydrolase [Pseudoclavibacter sp. CFCC 14310]KAB1646242.1 alpha/beta hydrolase [Pseudoclavibacter sp. CFCC 14310]
MQNERQQQAVTADGRVLSGTSYGPAGGRPVLFVAGAATSKLMTFGSDLLSTLNLQLLTMDRPGIGGSTPDPTRTLASTAADYLVFVSAVLGEQTGKVAVVANSQGAVFGLALACAGGADGLTLVSPADEIAHPRIHAMLPREATMLSDLAQTKPEEAAAILAGFSAHAMEEMVMSGSGPEDAGFYRREPFVSLYRRSLEEGFNNGGAGYVRDTLIAMRTWDLDLDAIDCTVQVLFGAGDITHSPDHGETLTGRIPGATRRVFPDAGGALLWTHAREILESVAA